MDSSTNQEARENKTGSNFWQELIKLVLIAVLVVIPFRIYIAQPFIVDGLSMYPTFNNGHYLVIDEISYRFKSPERGEVIVFRYPRDPSKHFIKRVIGLPGETVSIANGTVTIISDEYPSGLTIKEPYVELPKNDTIITTLGEGEYFVMGDNRSQSADSRIWGAVPEENIVGRPFIRFAPPALWPGDASHFGVNYSGSLEASNQNK